MFKTTQLLVWFCCLLLIWPCLSNITKRYCASEHQTEIDICAMENAGDKFKEIDRISDDCLKDLRPELTTIEEKLEFICGEIDTEEGKIHLECFDRGMTEHEDLIHICEECLEKYNS